MDCLSRAAPPADREDVGSAGKVSTGRGWVVDTSTASGRAMFGMCAVFAALEVDLLRERTLAGLEAARRRGVRLGRPAALDRRGRERALRLRRSGRSIREIAETLGVAVGTVHAVVRGE